MLKKLWNLLFGDNDNGIFVVEWKYRRREYWYGWQTYTSRKRAQQEVDAHAGSEKYDFRIKPNQSNWT